MALLLFDYILDTQTSNINIYSPSAHKVEASKNEAENEAKKKRYKDALLFPASFLGSNERK